MTSTATLADLLAGADAAGHDHAAAEKSTGLRHIHNHATGAVVWFPTWQAFRRTEDWAEAVAEQEAMLARATADGTSVAEAAAEHLEQQLEILLERAAVSADPNAFVEVNLVPHLTETWAVADAVARTSGEQLPDGTPPAGFASYPYELYRTGEFSLPPCGTTSLMPDVSGPWRRKRPGRPSSPFPARR